MGSGNPISIKKVAEIITEKINPNNKPIFNQNYRVGDIRHCVADISKIIKILRYKPTYTFEQGIEDLINWIESQPNPVKELSTEAMEDLTNKGLIK